MEIKQAIDAVEAGNFEGLSIFDLWELESVLSKSTSSAGKAAYKKFIENYSANLNADSQGLAPTIKSNIEALEKLSLDTNLSPESKNLFANISITNNSDTDVISADKFKFQMIRLSKLQAQEIIIKSDGFASKTTEEQSKIYKVAFEGSLQENFLVLVANQIKAPSFESSKIEAQQVIQGLVSGDKKYTITNTNIVGTFSAAMTKTRGFGNLLAKKTGLDWLAKRAKSVDSSMSKSFPKSWGFLKSASVSLGASLIAGPAGIAAVGAYGVYKTCKNIKSQAQKEEKTFFGYLKEHKGQAMALGGSIAATLVSCGGIVASGYDLGFLRPVVDNSYLVKTGLGMGGSVALASEELVNAMSAKTPAERKIRMNKFKNILVGSALGTAAGLGMAEGLGYVSSEFSNISSPEPESLVVEQDSVVNVVEQDSTTVVQVDSTDVAQPENTDVLGFTIVEHTSSYSSLDMAHMDRLSDLKLGSETVDSFYNSLEGGWVESFPADMSKEEYVARLTQLMQLAPVVHHEAIDLMIKDLKCPDFILTQEQLDLVAKAQSTITFDKDIGFGEYVGYEPTARTSNVTTHIKIEHDCGEKDVHITSHWNKVAFDRVETTEVTNIQSAITESTIIRDEVVVSPKEEVAVVQSLESPSTPLEAQVIVPTLHTVEPQEVVGGGSISGHADDIDDLRRQLGLPVTPTDSNIQVPDQTVSGHSSEYDDLKKQFYLRTDEISKEFSTAPASTNVPASADAPLASPQTVVVGDSISGHANDVDDLKRQLGGTQSTPAESRVPTPNKSISGSANSLRDFRNQFSR